MKLSYIVNNNSTRLLLIFAGWSTGPEAFEGLRCPGYDIAVASDYSDFTLPPIAGYGEVVLMAWSLGVHAAELAATALPQTLTIAVNGTPTPVSDTEGIPEAIFSATANNLTEQSLAKFRKRMGAAHLPRGSRSISELRQELSEFPRVRVPFRWDRAVISADDRIFPPANQERAWSGRAEIARIDGPHCPDFQQIVDRFVIDKSLVGSRFAKGRQTYEDAADVQHRIADHLMSLWQKHGLTARSVLEIGVGNGYFTSLYSPRLKGADITLWDIAPCSDTIIRADAEADLRTMHSTVDAIASASTMQWFNSAAAFLLNCSRVLNPGGLAVLSTFGPQTFKELTAAGVIPLPYLSEESLRRIVPDGMELLELHSGLITKVFADPMAVLRHLKATGVNARPCSNPVRTIADTYPRRPDGRCDLTYQPIYLILRKK